MKKIVLIIVLIFALSPAVTHANGQVNSTSAQTVYFYDGTWNIHNEDLIKLVFNGEEIATDIPPIIISDRTLIPARAFFEKLGAVVAFNNGKILVTGDNFNLSLSVNSRDCVLNGKTLEIDSSDPPPIIIKDVNDIERTLIPIRFVSESLGFNVDWKKGCVEINRKTSDSVSNVVSNHNEELVTITEDAPKPSETPKPSDINNKIVVIDPGHGGKEEPGSLGIKNGKTILFEKDVNLDISLQVAKILENKGIYVKMTRTEDVYVGLQSRADFANQANADIFVSIHNNSFTSEQPYGTMVYANLENPKSKKLADLIQKGMIKSMKTNDRGLADGTHLAVIRNTSMPAVITEGLFLSNPDDLQLLMRADIRTKMAEGIAEGILKYLE